LTNRKINDLHAVGELTIPCEKCKKAMKKKKGVLDVWFDSGVAPWASLGYPENNKELFEEHFPVDRINEAQDQIRGWFYSLMFCSAAVFGKAPYKGVSMVGWVVDKNGEKMSKSVADMLRYYFCWDVAPYEIQKFNMDIAKKEIGKIFMILWNLQNLANREKIGEDIEDKWILSRFNNMIREYRDNLERFESNDAMKIISEFILNDLSRRYVQMTREKKSGIVGYCLPEILKLLAPVAPFITEKIWQNLKEKGLVDEESVHLCSWPDFDKKKINEKLEKEFDLVYKIIELGLFERDKAKLGLRWPLSKIVVFSNEKISKEMKEIIKRQLNIKEVEQEKSDFLRIELDTEMNEDLLAEGYVRELARKIQIERKEKGLKNGDMAVLKISTEIELEKVIEKHLDFLKERTNLSKIEFSVDKSSEKVKQIEIRGKKLSIELE